MVSLAVVFLVLSLLVMPNGNYGNLLDKISDWLLVSPYSITLELKVRVMRKWK